MGKSSSKRNRKHQRGFRKEQSYRSGLPPPAIAVKCPKPHTETQAPLAARGDLTDGGLSADAQVTQVLPLLVPTTTPRSVPSRGAHWGLGAFGGHVAPGLCYFSHPHHGDPRSLQPGQAPTGSLPPG